MKFKFLLLLLFLGTFAFGQNLTFSIKYSEQLAVFVFMQNLSKNYPENVFKTEFRKSKYNVDKYNSILSKFDSLNIDYSYSFQEFPYGVKKPMQTREILQKHLLETDNLKVLDLGLLDYYQIKHYLT